MAAVKVDFDVECVAAPGNDGTPPPPPAPVRAGATVYVARQNVGVDVEQEAKPPPQATRYVVRTESGALLGPVPESAARRFPPTRPRGDGDGDGDGDAGARGGAPAEVRSVRRRPSAPATDAETAATTATTTTTTTVSVRVVLLDGGPSWPPMAGRGAEAAAAAAAAAARAGAAAAATAAADGGGDEAGYRARPEELARLALSSDVREALRDPRLQRLLRQIDGAPDRERALRAALGLPGGGGGGGTRGGGGPAAAAAPAVAGVFGVDGGAFQNFAAVVLEIMDGGGLGAGFSQQGGAAAAAAAAAVGEKGVAR